jgi:hypothetical protein
MKNIEISSPQTDRKVARWASVVFMILAWGGSGVFLGMGFYCRQARKLGHFGIHRHRRCHSCIFIYSVSGDSLFSGEASMRYVIPSRAPNTALEPTAAAPSFGSLPQIHACCYSRRGSALDR